MGLVLVMSHDYYWHFEKSSVYELVLVDFDGIGGMSVVYHSGYTAGSLRPILNALWYLNGYQRAGDLSDQQVKILEDIRRFVERIVV